MTAKKYGKISDPVKKVTKKPVNEIDPELRSIILTLVNKSRRISSTVLEAGSAMANDCHDCYDTADELAKMMKFKQDKHYWSNYKL